MMRNMHEIVKGHCFILSTVYLRVFCLELLFINRFVEELVQQTNVSFCVLLLEISLVAAICFVVLLFSSTVCVLPIVVPCFTLLTPRCNV